jgi:hypothetical protein
MEEDCCSICLLPNNYDVHITQCCHKFHVDCFRKHLKSTSQNKELFCPNCRFLLDKRLILEGCCIICNDVIFGDIKVSDCGHNFHIGCYNNHSKYNHHSNCNICNPSTIESQYKYYSRLRIDRKGSHRDQKREKPIHKENREKFFPKSRNI